MAVARGSLRILQQAVGSKNLKKLKMRGIFGQPHSREAVHSELERIMKVGGLKTKFKKAAFKKYAKVINHKTFSFTPS